MATYVNDLRLKEIGTGESSGTWGTETNVNLELIGDAMGLASKSIANASAATITMPDGTATNGELRSLYLKITGGGQACTVTLAPNTINKVWFVENNTNSILTMSQGSGANVAIAAGQTKAIATDGAGSGAAVFDVLTDLSVAGDLHVASTVNVLGDTAAGDKAAIGYASADGIVVTGQGSTSDVTLKNDADGDVLTIPTGTINVVVAGNLTANAGLKVKNAATSAGFVEFFEDSDNGTNKVTLIGPAATADVTVTLPAATDTLVGKATTDTLTNKTLTTPVLTTPIANAGIQLKNAAASAGFLEFFEDSDNGTNKVTLIGPAATADVTLVLPAAADTLVGKATTDTLTNKTLTTPVVTAGLQLKNAATSAGFIEFFEDSDNGANKVTLIGPASTADVTLTLPAAADTLVGKATTDTLTNKTLTTPVLTTPIANAGIQLKNGSTGAGFLEFFEDSDNGTNKVTLAGPASTADITLTLPSSAGSSGQALVTNGSGVLSFAAVGGLYNDWAVKTSAYTMVSGDQIIVNASGATTITVPASASAGDTVTIKATGGGTVTIGRNSQKINSLAADGTLSSGNAVQLVFVDATIGFLEI